MKFIDKIRDTIIVDNRYEYILEGLKNTLIIAFFALLIGFILGIIISIIRNNYKENKKNKILNFFATFYITVIRGTPAVLQLMILYYVIFKSVDINIVLVGIISFGLNSAAYVSEIIRAGIDSVDKGHKEAAKVLDFERAAELRDMLFELKAEDA